MLVSYSLVICVVDSFSVSLSKKLYIFNTFTLLLGHCHSIVFYLLGKVKTKGHYFTLFTSFKKSLLHAYLFCED